MEVLFAAADNRAAWIWAMLAGAAAAIALVLVLITLGASHPYYPTWVTFVVFALIFPVHFRTAIVGNRTRRRSADERAAMASFLRPWPLPIDRRLALLVVGVYAAAAALVVFSIPALAGGQPEKHGGHYYLDDHGTLTEVSRATYYSGEIATDRWFLTLSAIFLGLGFVINLRQAKGLP